MFKPKAAMPGLPSLGAPKSNLTPPPVRVGKGKVKIKPGKAKVKGIKPPIRGMGGLGGVPNPGSPMGGF